MRPYRILIHILLMFALFSSGIHNAFAQKTQLIKPTDRQNLRSQIQQNRKAAVTRYKAAFLAARKVALFNPDGKPKGYNPNGFTGTGVSQSINFGAKK